MAPPRKRQAPPPKDSSKGSSKSKRGRGSGSSSAPPPAPAASGFNTASSSRQRQNNPLLIGEVVDHVFSYLGKDLSACFDVCQLWRSLVPPHNIRYRSTRPPVVIKHDTRERNGGYEYMESVRKHDSFKANKFTFRNADLSSAGVEEFLNENGLEVEELEIFDETILTKGCKSSPMTASGLTGLLQNNMPNLTNLIIKELPTHIQTAVFSSSIPLALRRFEITTTCYPGYRLGARPHASPFLRGLFAASPQLEEIKLTDWKSHDNAGYVACIIVEALVYSHRLKDIRILEFGRADPTKLISDQSQFPALVNHLTSGQLRTFIISKAVFVSNFAMGGSTRTHMQDPADVRQFLASQAASLEYLELPIARMRPRRGAPVPLMTQMPNLLELKLQSTDDPRHPNQVSLQGPLNYATDFPRLKVLGLKGLLENYLEDEIVPDFAPPSGSVQVLQEIPLGADQGLMARIGRLFPNLNIIRTPIANYRERLLTAVWEFCPNISELYLTFGADEERFEEDDEEDDDDEAADMESLDCLFSGIPEAECKRLRELLPAELGQEMTKLDFDELRAAAGTTSITNLKRLKRLVIDGLSDTLGGHQMYAVREDKLSDVFAFSILAEAVTKLKELVFFQARVEVAKFSAASVQAVCEKSGLEQVIAKQSPGSAPKIVRFIRPGFGFEGLGAIPKNWYGLTD